MYVAQPIEWTEQGVVMLDQRRLPAEEITHTYTDYVGVAKAIREMVIRGAPAIGVAAAMGVAIGVQKSTASSVDQLQKELVQICETLAKTRPTAVDLFWALERMKMRFAAVTESTSDLAEIRKKMIAEALEVHLEKKAADEAIGRFGAEYMPKEGQVMTQCNAGALATAGIGTALGVIRVAYEQGRKIHVLVPETRPYLQGARLTAWELYRGGIPLTLITDNMVGHFLKTGKVGAIVTGADRIAANGDVANKIGTYGLAVLARHHGVQHLSFTGSVAVGQQVQAAAAKNTVPVTLELGGKSPQVVFADADLDAALPFLVNAGIQNAGQTCSAASRILVERPVFEQVRAKMAERYRALRVGPAAADLDLGPVISRRQKEIVDHFLALARDSGLAIAGEGSVVADAPKGGYYVRPTLVGDVPPDHSLAQDEIFGPVQVLIAFDGEAEAIRIANGTKYGLVAGVWTKDGARQMRMARALRCGQVFINNYGAGGGIELPFGGVKHSGHGREKGFEALYGFSTLKTIAIKHD
jgi:S-methyl-5-thioribose-1-phosphate isomerase